MRALFRCDASVGVGIGHVMRCLAFADTLRWAGWSCAFATGPETIRAVPALASSGVAMRPAEDARLDVADATLMVVDHYGLDAGFERQARAQGATVVVFDDLADRPHDCAILVDPTPGRPADDYRDRVPGSCRLMLGPKHAILHERWLARRPDALARLAQPRPVERIVVSMGGTDPRDATSRVLAALAQAKLGVHVDVILGAGAPQLARIAGMVGPGVTLHVDPPDPAAIAATADLAIGAPGTSSFERAALGLPAILIPLADNQRFVAAAFAAGGAAEIVPAESLDDPAGLAARTAALAVDAGRRIAMSRKAAALTDGRGSLRLLAAVAGDEPSKGGAPVRLRLAETEDEAWLLDLQRQETTRRHARNPAVPGPTEHAAWFAGILNDPARLLALAEVDGVAVGMVRLDRLAEEAASFEVSIAIESRRHGEGIGRAALALVRRLAPGVDLVATVMPGNRPSLALFASAGYRPEGRDRYRSRAA